jgi:hypothetical protein
MCAIVFAKANTLIKAHTAVTAQTTNHCPLGLFFAALMEFILSMLTDGMDFYKLLELLVANLCQSQIGTCRQTFRPSHPAPASILMSCVAAPG